MNPINSINPMNHLSPPTLITDSDCPICIGAFNDLFVRASCGHQLHDSCNEKWIRGKNLASRTCALCRAIITHYTNDNGVTYRSSFFPNKFLVEACGKGDIQDVKRCLNSGISINGRAFDDGGTGLIVASQNGHTEIVDKLIEKGADVNSAANNDATALIVASQNGHTEIVDKLIEKGAEVNAITRLGTTALIQGSENGNTAIVDNLIEKGAEVNAIKKNGYTALILASQNGYTDIVKSLTKKNAKADVVAHDGATALTQAKLNGHTEIVDILESYMNSQPLCD